MNLIWRCLSVLLFSRFSSKVNLFDESFISFRVLPTDIDMLQHMNNGRYFSFLDLGRLDYLVRLGRFKLLKKLQIHTVVASEMIRFKKSLKLFARFQVGTRLLGWDDKFVYMVHHVKKNNEMCALGLVKLRFVQPSIGSKSPSDVLKLMGNERESPSLPEWVKYWQRADKEFHDETMAP